ncbi:FxSxx-COOH system tetratricopeptide repeat protein [Actinoplanes sp. NPDC051475]|uniref:FxSxx-COOH system tetratricopeptide repeat protein n=1 Tax=Actinoplanes sp. NPDC051475 TaxID=3157225 RepID=UPI00344C2AA4
MAGFIFVSYSRQDTAYVDRLAAHLQQAGLAVWRDTEGITYGDRWELTIRDRVDDCAAVVVVMSPAAEASPHVGNELQRARDLGKQVLPVLISGQAFFALGTTHHFDARDGGLPDDRFLHRLTELAGAPPVTVRPARPGPSDAGQQIVVGDPPGQAVAWQDRPGLLQDLVESAGAGGTTVVCALAGQRGVGKTQLAAAYARLRIQHGWPIIVWATAETEAGIVAALDELAGVAGVRQAGTDPQQAARAALRWLRTRSGPALLVYDNAVDADLIRAWTPPFGSAQTVVTTTHRDLDGLGDLIDVTLFTPGEAVDYLRRRTKVDDPDRAAQLAEELGQLPLALAQAAAVIGPGRRYPTYEKYLVALQETDAARLLARSPGDPYPHGLAEAVFLSIEDLASVDRDGHARRLLDRLAVLAPTGADAALLDHLIATDDAGRERADDEPVEADALVAALSGRSLTVAAEETDRIVVHRLVQRVVRERSRHTGTLDAAIIAAATALREAADRVGLQWAARALIGEYAAHMEALLTNPVAKKTHRSLLTARLSVLYWLREVHNYTAALPFGVALLADCELTLGGMDRTTMTTRLNLAAAYRAVGRLNEALDLHARTATDRERVLGPDHPDTLNSRNELAAAYQAVGRLEEATDLYARTLADRERLLGPDHPRTLTSRNNLANAYQALGRLDEAVELYTRNVADCHRVLGPDHPRTSTSRNNLAYAYHVMGRLDEAIDLYTQTVADQERVLGPDHPDTLVTCNNLAGAYKAADRLDEAIALNVRTLADRRRVLGPDHPDTQTSLGNLIAAYLAAGRSDEANALRNDQAQ